MEWSKLLCEERIRPSKARSNDLRTQFERDYHRIIGSASFRRLQDKTQVFPLDTNDFVRTRLTHSLEVSSFAKSLGQSVGQKILDSGIDPGFLPQYRDDISDILQCAGLIHDIGNPPFGHFGEEIIQEWFQANLPKMEFKGKPVTEYLNEQMLREFYQFEGNTQAFRLVSKLHFLVDEHGMNLTKALLCTIIKYPVSSLESDRKAKDIRLHKMGYFLADKETFDIVEEACGTNGARHPLTFLLEAADDIAYLTADIEDAYRKGYFTYDGFVKNLRSYPYRSKDRYDIMVNSLEKLYENAVQQGLSNPGDYAIQNWVISVQGQALHAVSDSFIKHYDEIMAGTYPNDLFRGTYIELMMRALGEIADRFAFQSKSIYLVEMAAKNILEYLLSEIVDAAIVYDSDVRPTSVQLRMMAFVSDNYTRSYRLFSQGKSEEEKLYLRLHLATDTICGMTDSYAQLLYREMMGLG